MDRIISGLTLYNRDSRDADYSILEDMASVCRRARNRECTNGEDKSGDDGELRLSVSRITGRLLDMALDYGFRGDVWTDYVALLLLTSENTFSRMCERRGAVTGTITDFAEDDLRRFRQLADYDFAWLDEMLETNDFDRIRHFKAGDTGRVRYTNISCKVNELAEKLASAKNDEDFVRYITDFYRRFGSGRFGLNKALRVVAGPGGIDVVPVHDMANCVLDDIIGYESQKQELTANTRAFANGLSANNVLLYGDSGTGKSTSIKAIINEFYDDGIRMIEIYKHQFEYLTNLLALLKGRNYKFIIYMDDLSFEENENQFKFLKAVIEGGVETKPDNVLIYATSNRRHLIKETWHDRSDADYVEDMHHSETMEEKLSLAARFGTSIFYPKPGRQEFLDIIEGIMKQEAREKNGSQGQEGTSVMDRDELAALATKWEMRHGGLSGRTARQFVTYLQSITTP